MHILSGFQAMPVRRYYAGLPEIVR